MAKKKEETEATEEVEEKIKEEKMDVELVQTIKETGIGLKLPDETVLDVSELNNGLVQWMKWMTETVNKINKSVGY